MESPEYYLPRPEIEKLKAEMKTMEAFAELDMRYLHLSIDMKYTLKPYETRNKNIRVIN